VMTTRRKVLFGTVALAATVAASADARLKGLSLGAAATVPSPKPSAQWNGTAGTGWGGANPPAPVDPPVVNGKPAIKIIDPDGTMIAGDAPAGRYIGVHSLCSNGAGDFGTSTVEMGIEGTFYPLPLTYRTWVSNLDGVTVVGAWAYWAYLDPAVWTANGWADVYFRCTPHDAIQEVKVIGPYKYGRQANFVGMAVTVDPTQGPSGNRYQTFKAARTAIRAAGAVNAEITLVVTGDYDIPITNEESFPYAGLEKGFITVKCAPGVTANWTRAGTPGSVSPRTTGLKFTGPRMKFDLSKFPTFAQEGGLRSMWFDGVEFANPGGRNIAFKQNYTEIFAGSAYFTECHIRDTLWGVVQGAQLIRNTKISTIVGDATFPASNVYGLTVNDINNSYFYQFRNALTLQYAGAGAGTVAKTGGNADTAGTLVLVLNGVTNTILLNDFDKTVANVVAEINAIGGMTATTSPGHAVLPSIFLCRQATGMGAFTAIDAKTAPIVLDTFGDFHSDLTQQPPDGALVQNMLAWDCTTAELLFMKDQTFRDVIYANYAASLNGDGVGSGLTQVHNSHRNVHLWHLSILDQDCSLSTIPPTTYVPDAMCSIRSSVLQRLSFAGAPNTNLKIANVRVLNGTGLPAQTTGGVVGGTAATLYNDVPNGDWTIKVGSPLLSDLVARAPGLPYNAYNVPRASMTTKGAI
jgi:hypothetical protein